MGGSNFCDKDSKSEIKKWGAGGGGGGKGVNK